MSDIIRLREILEEERERREQLRDEISFNRCRNIKRIGEFYRDATLPEVVSEFGLSRSEARKFVVDYVKLVNEPTDQVPLRGMLIGIKFYGGQYTLSEIIDEMDVTSEDAQLFIREFVGVTLAEQEREIDLRAVSIPEDVKYPESVVETVADLRETVVMANTHFAESIYSATRQISSMFRDLTEQFRPLILQLRNFAREVRNAIEEGISNFEKPVNYDSESVQLNSIAQAAGAEYIDEVLRDIDEIDEHPLDPYRSRLETGINDFRDGRFFTPIFTFISLQDGIMHWLCEQENIPTDSDNRFGEPVYKWDTKRDQLARLYQDWYGVSTGEFISNLESFYAHRNAIMHGDPVAFFDENIATISMLFLLMTLDTALHYSYDA